MGADGEAASAVAMASVETAAGRILIGVGRTEGAVVDTEELAGALGSLCQLDLDFHSPTSPALHTRLVFRFEQQFSAWLLLARCIQNQTLK
jgi:hypothetical protein